MRHFFEQDAHAAGRSVALIGAGIAWLYEKNSWVGGVADIHLEAVKLLLSGVPFWRWHRADARIAASAAQDSHVVESSGQQ